ncbi:Mitochondrial mRNA pseudouridine synthase Trub2 [Lamellibrachia satsuma]|nr:Mitochondrial mRNA pseudouridine synthase Trub2 [Lamellibrachia satsuma]
MAKTGLIRPKNPEAGPVIYGMKCIEFDPPDFTLEVHAINEQSDYLAELVHELGLEMKASAVCKLVRRIRYGHFTLTHALLRKHWNLEAILENIDYCRPLVAQQRLQRQRQLVEQQFPAGAISSTDYLPPSDSRTSHS